MITAPLSAEEISDLSIFSDSATIIGESNVINESGIISIAVPDTIVDSSMNVSIVNDSTAIILGYELIDASISAQLNSNSGKDIDIGSRKYQFDSFIDGYMQVKETNSISTFTRIIHESEIKSMYMQALISPEDKIFKLENTSKKGFLDIKFGYSFSGLGWSAITKINLKNDSFFSLESLIMINNQSNYDFYPQDIHLYTQKLNSELNTPVSISDYNNSNNSNISIQYKGSKISAKSKKFIPYKSEKKLPYENIYQVNKFRHTKAITNKFTKLDVSLTLKLNPDIRVLAGDLYIYDERSGDKSLIRSIKTPVLKSGDKKNIELGESNDVVIRIQKIATDSGTKAIFTGGKKYANFEYAIVIKNNISKDAKVEIPITYPHDNRTEVLVVSIPPMTTIEKRVIFGKELRVASLGTVK